MPWRCKLNPYPASSHRSTSGAFNVISQCYLRLSCLSNVICPNTHCFRCGIRSQMAAHSRPITSNLKYTHQPMIPEIYTQTNEAYTYKTKRYKKTHLTVTTTWSDEWIKCSEGYLLFDYLSWLQLQLIYLCVYLFLQLLQGKKNENLITTVFTINAIRNSLMEIHWPLAKYQSEK